MSIKYSTIPFRRNKDLLNKESKSFTTINFNDWEPSEELKASLINVDYPPSNPKPLEKLHYHKSYFNEVSNYQWKYRNKTYPRQVTYTDCLFHSDNFGKRVHLYHNTTVFKNCEVDKISLDYYNSPDRDVKHLEISNCSVGEINFQHYNDSLASPNKESYSQKPDSTLETLLIENCPRLLSIPSLLSLKKLTIKNCPISSLPHLPKLEELIIEGCPNLVKLYLPTTLKKVELSYCPNLMVVEYDEVDEKGERIKVKGGVKNCPLFQGTKKKSRGESKNKEEKYNPENVITSLKKVVDRLMLSKDLLTYKNEELKEKVKKLEHIIQFDREMNTRIGYSF